MTLISIENGALFIPGDKTRRTILKDINWSIKPLEHTLIIGQNGAGKSTFLRLLAGQLWLTRGNIKWFYEKNWESSPIIGQEICRLISPAYIYKTRQQKWGSTGKDLIFCNSGNKDNHNSIYKLFVQSGIVDEKDFPQNSDVEKLLALPVAGLSQGQLKLAVLLHAVLNRPRILLLDEYLENIDQENRKIIDVIIGNIIQHTTIILTSHRPTSHIPWIKKTYEIADGKLFLCDLSKNYYKNAEDRSLKYPENAKRLRQIQPICQNQAQSAKVCELKNISVYVDRCLVLKKINWTILKGENWRLSGKNGSGKTTLLKLLAKWEYPASGGSINFWTLEGKSIETRKHHNSIFAFVSNFCEEIYDYDVTAMDLVLSGLDNSIGNYRRYSVQETYWAQRIISHFFKNSATTSLSENNSLLTTSIRQISTGQLRKLFLARALINQPKVILLDEPCSGLDQNSRNDFLQNLELLTSQGINILQDTNSHNNFINIDNILFNTGQENIYKPQIIIVSHFDEDIPSTVTKEACLQDGSLSIR